MSRFVFEYDALLRYRRHRRDLVRQLLADLLHQLAEHDRERADVEADRRRQLDEIDAIFTAGGRINVDRAAARRFHSRVLTARIHDVDRQREVVDQQIGLCRRALVEADRDVRAIERLRESRADEHRQNEERRVQAELEDAWQAGHTLETRG